MTGRRAVIGMAGCRSCLEATTAQLADEIIARDLPELRADQRAAAVRMVLEAVAQLPDSVRPGVSVASFAVRAVRRWPGSRGGAVALPVLRDYVRLVRGLSVAAACEVSPERAVISS